VWFLTGLWHGASWNFILWGLFFCAFPVVEKLGLLKLLAKIPAFFSRAYLLIVVFFGWILFRFSDFTYIPIVIKGLFGLNGNEFFDFETKTLLLSNIFFIIVAVFSVTPIIKHVSDFLKNSQNASVKRVVYAVLSIVLPIVLLFLSTIALIGDAYNPFLYFQF
jgi:alginate O-acetyltransferase complex protein AlgI